jgi:HTH-type transcriptional repressor of NAD biosynthesis genes
MPRDGQPRAGSIGVAVGKFNPPHLGHLHLLSYAAERVEQLFVLLGDRSDQTIAAHDRQSWLTDACPPNVTVIVTPDDLPEASEPWAERALAVLPGRPNIAFTSEAWGPEWAARMGAEHMLVDLARTTVPISATVLRADLGFNFHWLVPAARAALARRVVLIGAESTGKSTMAEALARELGTTWVPEHGRYYWRGRRHLADQTWHSDEFRRIAAAQRRLEQDLARRSAGGVVIADTDALVTAVWHRRYVGFEDAALESQLADHAPELYLVCCPDFEWVQDGTRESCQQRDRMHEAMLRRAKASNANVELLTGAHEQRLARALAVVRPLTVFPPLI